MEIITGKLRTAIKIWLLLAFDEMPESKVNEVEKPKEVNKRVARKSIISEMGLFRNRINSTKPSIDNAEHRRKL